MRIGGRYLVRLDDGSLVEARIVELSPEGRVKVVDLGTGTVRWLDRLEIVEELPDEPKGSLHDRIVRE